MGRIKYSPEEDNLIRDYLLEHGTTTGLVIEGRTPTSIMARLYKLRKNGLVPPIGSTFSDPQNVEIVKEIISNNPDNLRRAFNIISERFDIPANTIKTYWYSENSPISRHNIGACFATVGKKGIVNRKNIKRNADLTRDTMSLWDRIKRTLSRIF